MTVSSTRSRWPFGSCGQCQDWIKHSTDDRFWKSISPDHYYTKMKIPVLDVEGWYDAFLAGGVQNFTGMTNHAGTAYARENQHIVIGPWDHIGWGRPDSIEAPTVVNLNNGIVRASFRKSLSHPTPITPGKIYRYSITVWPSAYELAAGDQIRLEISSSDYPQFAPNPNTGARFGTTTRTRIARQTVSHDRAHPSEVTLPIIPADASSPSTPTFPMPSTK